MTMDCQQLKCSPEMENVFLYLLLYSSKELQFFYFFFPVFLANLARSVYILKLLFYVKEF